MRRNQLSNSVFLNRCAAAHLCAVSYFQVCRQFFCPYSSYPFDENKDILFAICDIKLFF